MNAKVPSAIAQITLNRATFDNETVEQLSFVNFFYGNNGAGKSSIAYAIQEQDGITWNYGESPDRYDLLVYNTEYINRNFVNYGELEAAVQKTVNSQLSYAASCGWARKITAPATLPFCRPILPMQRKPFCS